MSNKAAGAVEHQLKHPIDFNGARVLAVYVRRPKVRDLEAMDRAGSSAMARSVALLVNLCELPPDAIRDLDGEDFSELDELVTGMLGKRPARP